MAFIFILYIFIFFIWQYFYYLYTLCQQLTRLLKKWLSLNVTLSIIFLKMQHHKKIINWYFICSKSNSKEYRKILLFFNCNPLSIRIHFWLRTNWASVIITICLYFFWGSLCVFWRLLFLQEKKNNISVFFFF